LLRGRTALMGSEIESTESISTSLSHEIKNNFFGVCMKMQKPV